jgi:hypothetical protein
MQFDSADVANLVAAGQFDEVILHEMGHVLGIGTIWTARGLLVGGGTADPQFTGANAVTEYNALFGTSGTSVPVENVGGSGIAGSHWRESVFETELMTGFLDAGVAVPLSRVTVASLADLGYVVDLAAADPYTAPLRAASSVRSRAVSVDRGRIVALPYRDVNPGAGAGIGTGPGPNDSPGGTTGRDPVEAGPGQAVRRPGFDILTGSGSGSQTDAGHPTRNVTRPDNAATPGDGSRPASGGGSTTVRPLASESRPAPGIAPGAGLVAARGPGAGTPPVGIGLVASAPPVVLVPAPTATVPSAPDGAVPGPDPAPAADPASAERDERTAQGWLTLARTLQGRGRNEAARGWLDRIVRELPATRAAPDARKLLDALPPAGR